jgi:hypothetical protein
MIVSKGKDTWILQEAKFPDSYFFYPEMMKRTDDEKNIIMDRKHVFANRKLPSVFI